MPKHLYCKFASPVDVFHVATMLQNAIGGTSTEPQSRWKLVQEKIDNMPNHSDTDSPRKASMQRILDDDVAKAGECLLFSSTMNGNECNFGIFSSRIHVNFSDNLEFKYILQLCDIIHSINATKELQIFL